MAFLHRLKTLFRLGQLRARGSRSGWREDSMAASLAAVAGGYLPPRRGSEELLRAYAQLPWLHAVVRRRAEALAGTQWVLHRSKRVRRAQRLDGVGAGWEVRQRAVTEHLSTGALERVYEHALLDLLEHPAPGLTAPAFWELTSKYMDLVGEAPAAIERGPRGQPLELVPIVPTWVQQVPTPATPWFHVQTPRGALRVPQEDVLWWRQHDPASPYVGRGVGTAGALGDELETDEYMALTAKSRFLNRAQPDLMIGLMGRPGGTGPGPSQEAISLFAQELRDKHQGVERAGQTHVVSGDFRAQLLGHTMVESQYIEGRRFLRDTCIQVFGTPPEILGVLNNSNRSTIDAAGDHFARYSTVPMLERLRAQLNAQLTPEYGADLVLDYVSPIPADKQFERSVMVALPTAFKVNEVRALCGRAPVPWGDERYQGPGMVPVAGQTSGVPEDGEEAA